VRVTALAPAMGAVLLACSALVGCRQDEPRPAKSPPAQAPPAAPEKALQSQRGPSARRASQLLADLAQGLPAVLADSRRALLGTSNPNGPERVKLREVGSTDTGYEPPKPADPNGGPGNRMLQFFYFDHAAKTPLEELRWHRREYPEFLKSMRDGSRRVSLRLADHVKQASALAGEVRSWPSVPEEFKAAEVDAGPGWAAICLAEVNAAASMWDAEAAKLWADELAAGLRALEDLHRWLEFLLENQLANMELVDNCAGLFTEAQTQYGPGKYDTKLCISRFPSGNQTVIGINNYFEVERQARRLFRDPGTWPDLVTSRGREPAIAAVNLPPDLREAFLELRSHLSPANRKTWDRAAAMPFERGFMANMIFRAQASQVVDRLGMVLERFDSLHPQATVAEMMDVLPYRAGLGMAGYEWADRYDARLIDAAANLAATDPHEALRAARRFQYGVYGGDKYQGMVLSLRKALDTGRMDCIRATDMIAATYRNAGWPGFRLIRFCRGTSGHSVAAAESGNGGRTRTEIVDGLFAPGKAEGTWPDEYFTRDDGTWAVELFARGLDSQVYLGAYILRGPQAGTLVRARVPYLPGHQEAESRKVYDGPYPGQVQGQEARGSQDG